MKEALLLQAFDRAALRFRGARADLNFPVQRKKENAADRKESLSSESAASAGKITAETIAGPVVSLPYTGESPLHKNYYAALHSHDCCMKVGPDGE